MPVDLRHLAQCVVRLHAMPKRVVGERQAIQAPVWCALLFHLRQRRLGPQLQQLDETEVHVQTRAPRLELQCLPESRCRFLQVIRLQQMDAEPGVGLNAHWIQLHSPAGEGDRLIGASKYRRHS